MSAQVSWYIQNRVILIVMEADVTMDGIQEMNTDIVALLESGNPPVHVIFEASKMNVHPSKVVDLVNTLTFLKHPNLGWDLTIAPNRLVKFLGTVVNNITGAKQVQFVDTIEEGMARLKKLDTSIGQ
jgi:hypothetical protein